MGLCCVYPYPGEMLSSAVARIVRYTSLSLVQIDKLTGYNLRYRHNGAFCSELLGFFNEMTEGRLSVIDMVYANTIFPMVMQFASEKIAEQHRQLENWSKISKAERESLSISWRRLILKPTLCFCRQCFHEQQEMYGENYWKLIWQIPLADMCEVHNCALIKTNLSTCPTTTISMPSEIVESKCHEIEKTKHSYLLIQTISRLLKNQTLTSRKKWCKTISELAKDADITDLKIRHQNNETFVISKMLAGCGKEYWGKQWLSQNYRPMLTGKNFHLGNYWLTYMILIKALGSDIEFPHVR